MELDSTTMFPPGTNVMFIRSTGEPVLAQVVGHSEHSDAYRHITYDCDGKTVLHDCASVRRLSNVRVWWWCGPPGGGLGDRHLATVPQGVMGDRLPWGGERQGGGGYFTRLSGLFRTTVDYQVEGSFVVLMWALLLRRATRHVTGILG